MQREKQHRGTRVPPHPLQRLDRIGFEVGVRNMELLSYREKVPRRKPEILDALRFIHSTAWPHMFGKPADDLQQAAAVSEHCYIPSSLVEGRRGAQQYDFQHSQADDEYMISDCDLLTSRFVSVPKSYGSFNPGGLVAGIIRGMLDAAGFPAR